MAVFYTFRSVDYVVSRDFLFFLISYSLVFFLVVQAPSPQEGRWIVLAVIILGVVTSLYGLYQYFWGFQGLISKIKGAEALPASVIPLTDEIIGRLESRRILSTFLLPSHFAAFLGIGIPLSVALILIREGWVRYLFGGAAGVQTVALYLTKSFSGWLSLIVASGCFFFIYLGYIKKKVKTRYVVFFLIGLVLVLLSIFAGLSLQRPDNPLAAIENNPLVLRVLNWGTTVEMILDHPWIGKGLHTFGLIYPSYQGHGVNVVHHSHNTYLQLGVEMGILGAIVSLWFACWWIRQTVRTLRETRDTKKRMLVSASMIAGMSFFVHQALDFEFYLPSVTLPGFAILALAIGVQKKHEVYKMAVKKNRRSFFTAGGFATAIAVSLLLLVPFYGNMYFQRGRSLLSADRPYFAERPSLIDEAAADLRKAIRLDPANSEYHYRYGVLLVQRFSFLREGIAEVQKAIQLSPWRHYYHFDLGMIYLSTGAREKGLEAIKKASQLYPLNEDYHQWLRRIYLHMGEKALATQEEQWIQRIQREGGARTNSP